VRASIEPSGGRRSDVLAGLIRAHAQIGPCSALTNPVYLRIANGQDALIRPHPTRALVRSAVAEIG
jgi:hypothetical protein